MTFSLSSGKITFRHLLFNTVENKEESNDLYENYDLRLLIKVGTSFLENEGLLTFVESRKINTNCIIK